MLKDQTDQRENGLYVWDRYSGLIRTVDMDGSPGNEVSGGNICSVGLNALDDTFYFVWLRICIESLLLCNFRLRGWLIKPILRIECFSFHVLQVFRIDEYF